MTRCSANRKVFLSDNIAILRSTSYTSDGLYINNLKFVVD